LKLMADYTAFPLWSLGSGVLGQRMVEPSSLPISAPIRERLLSWAAVYDNQDPFSEDWVGPPSEDAWIEQGRLLARDLQNDLGDNFEVVYFNNRSGALEPM
jgi:hypothetical protein